MGGDDAGGGESEGSPVAGGGAATTTLTSQTGASENTMLTGALWTMTPRKLASSTSALSETQLPMAATSRVRLPYATAPLSSTTSSAGATPSAASKLAPIVCAAAESSRRRREAPACRSSKRSDSW